MCAMVDAVRKVGCDCVVEMWPFAKLLWTLATRTHLQGARVSTYHCYHLQIYMCNVHCSRL